MTPLTCAVDLPDTWLCRSDWNSRPRHDAGVSVLFGLVFYLAGVVAYHWVGLDLSKREDWSDIPG